MKMSPKVVVIGSVIILFTIVLIMVVTPWFTVDRNPSEIFRSRSELEAAGRKLYIANGCVYCHSQSVRTVDWGMGAERIAQVGDYVEDLPILLGSQRTGPDLSQDGGEHPDDWHVAHFMNPRSTRTLSIMPRFNFLERENIDALTAYVQSLGLKDADRRMRRQREWKAVLIEAYEAGPEKNVEILHAHVPEGWRNVPNPYPTTPAGLARGHKIYQDFCLGCHGPVGDGMGPAQPYIYPPPLNFTILKDRGVSGGIIYYQIMNGITGSAMPYFKKDLESEKIWEVGNYVAEYFINQSDANTEPRGIDAAYEP
ncbi:cytochrome C oxidase [Desulfonema ishimotonii]|uniref:Cytochrome C oxidase n=1 Tax=Desulfonema ishimotonii TaxID=45657 RepID=A0A401FS49_9BACT|nr:cbb3-type cytochrome c oxidase subunit II [Desulfonema ishimotonii]GBC59786.1 cytochrome C oxidase [Desulfonema ishimotonii]